MAEKVDIRKLSPYVRHRAEKKDYELNPPEWVLKPVTAVHNGVNNVCQYFWGWTKKY